MMNVATLSASVGFIAAIVVGVWQFDERYVDHSEHTRDVGGMEHKVELYAERTHDYLHDLRIEQYEDRVWQLEQKKESEGLNHDEKRRLERTNEQLKKLYQLKEEHR